MDRVPKLLLEEESRPAVPGCCTEITILSAEKLTPVKCHAIDYDVDTQPLWPPSACGTLSPTLNDRHRNVKTWPRSRTMPEYSTSTGHYYDANINLPYQQNTHSSLRAAPAFSTDNERGSPRTDSRALPHHRQLVPIAGDPTAIETTGASECMMGSVIEPADGLQCWEVPVFESFPMNDLAMTLWDYHTPMIPTTHDR